MKTKVAAVLSMLSLVSGCMNSPSEESTVVSHIDRIAFGSCAVQVVPQTFWSQIANHEPDLFIFGGDNVYGDLKMVDGQPRIGAGSPELLASNYEMLARDSHFSSFRDRIPILPVWDDHDYGENDAGGSYEYKLDSERQFLDFWQIPESDLRRSYPGTYHVEMYGAAGEQVQIILLDTRYFRSELKEISDQRRATESGPDASGVAGKYMPDTDPKKTLLGSDQWHWLEEQLQQPADIRLIVSSIQVLAEGHGWERWGNLPQERSRLFNLIAQHEVNGVIFLSGDRHRAALYELKDSDIGYPLVELTSSSLNYPFPGGDEMGPYQLGEMYEGPNYSTIEIDWQTRRVELNIRHSSGEPVRSKVVDIDRLKSW